MIDMEERTHHICDGRRRWYEEELKMFLATADATPARGGGCFQEWSACLVSGAGQDPCCFGEMAMLASPGGLQIDQVGLGR